MKRLRWKQLDSSNVKSFAYDGDDLYVSFAGGSIYKYEAVPLKVVKDLKRAESAGKFMSESIKGKYDYEKLNETE